MLNKNELALLRHVFIKNHVGFTVIEYDELIQRLTDNRLSTFLELSYQDGLEIAVILNEIADKTVYRITDSLDRIYSLIRLPDEKKEILIIGPYLPSALSVERIEELKGVEATAKHKRLTEYLASLTVIQPASPLSLMLSAFCERMWETQHFTSREIYCRGEVSEAVVFSQRDNVMHDTMINMMAMERRYALENEIMEAVTLGRMQMEKKLSAVFTYDNFESRAADPLRNAKNYSVIMNTLLRKAAERGGVHPLYLDRISSEFAARIENMPSLTLCKELMCDMFRGYCRLVRKHTVQKYSPVVQKSMLIIDNDLSVSLSTGAIARAQGISTGYLSSVFKKEVGESLSEYIHKKRINYASHLLQTTDDEIQSIALKCGIVDTQYFSKLFKKHKGMTPTQYRQRTKRG